jgi:hypothetical protein
MSNKCLLVEIEFDARLFCPKRILSLLLLHKIDAQEESMSFENVQSILEEISEETEEDGETRRRQTKLMKDLAPGLEHIEQDKRMELFGSKDTEGIFDMMYTTEDHRQRVIESQTMTIESSVSEGIAKMNEKLQS